MRKLPLHPLFFALFPVISFTVHNYLNVSFDHSFFFCYIVAILIAILAFCIAFFPFRDLHRAGFAASLFIVIFFSYGHFYSFFQMAGGLWSVLSRHRFLLPSIVLLVVIAVFFITSLKNKRCEITFLFNITSCVLLALPIVQGASITLRSDSLPKLVINNIFNTLQLSPTASKLDIYYIILDQYPGNPCLAKTFLFDNTYFTDQLRRKGFFTSDSQHSNYGITQFSIGSSLSMDYLHNLGVPLESKPDSRTVKQTFDLVKYNRVSRLLKNIGYKYIHIGSWFGPLEKNAEADVNFQGGYLNEFSLQLLQTTILCVLDNKIMAADYRRRLKRTMDYLQSVPNQKGPKFVFAHIICPHGPFVLDKNGQSRPIVYDETDKNAFLGQVQFINSSIIPFIDNAMNSGKKCVIIIQGDHGSGSNKSKGSTSIEYVRERFSILNAIYLPTANKSQWPEVRTPVNTFRAVFNIFFNTNLPYLPERSFVSRSFAEAYHLINVTDIVSR